MHYDNIPLSIDMFSYLLMIKVKREISKIDDKQYKGDN